MGQILHGSAKTTHAIRGELQRSQASVASLAKRFSINEKTVLKWRHRQSVEDMPMGPKERRSTVLSAMEEAAIVALRVQARRPLDDVYIALKDVIPQAARNLRTIAARSFTDAQISLASTTPYQPAI
jgi:transposase-like protein